MYSTVFWCLLVVFLCFSLLYSCITTATPFKRRSQGWSVLSGCTVLDRWQQKCCFFAICRKIPILNGVRIYEEWSTLKRVSVFVCLTLNPFAPEPPVRIHVLSTSRDFFSFNGQGQLCPLTCAELRDLSNYTRMSTIQSRTLEKKAKNHVRLTCKSP